MKTQTGSEIEIRTIGRNVLLNIDGEERFLTADDVDAFIIMLRDAKARMAPIPAQPSPHVTATVETADGEMLDPRDDY